MLKEKIEKDFKEALLKRNEREISTLRMLKAAILEQEKEKRYKKIQEKGTEADLEKESALSDEEIIKLILREIKKRKEAILEFEKGKRKDLVEKETQEIEILKRYLPEMLSEEEIKKMAKETIEKVRAKNIKDMGRVMKELMPKIQGKAEPSLVSQIVKNLLQNN
jgi:uncharacterized protein YqeY